MYVLYVCTVCIYCCMHVCTQMFQTFSSLLVALDVIHAVLLASALEIVHVKIPVLLRNNFLVHGAELVHGPDLSEVQIVVELEVRSGFVWGALFHAHLVRDLVVDHAPEVHTGEVQDAEQRVGVWRESLRHGPIDTKRGVV